MKFNLSDRTIITMLVLALVAQILLLLWHMEIIQFGNSFEQQATGVVAGKVQSVENSLKRRPLDSLIWSTTESPDEVYFHDSILTLSQSRAKIELNNGTQINLAENTLITIEPNQEATNSEIRIQFSQGNLRARNPYKTSTIKDEDISINLSANSEVEVTKTKDGKMEIFLHEGNGQIINDEKEVKIKKNQLLKVDNKEISSTTISENLKWVRRLNERIYTHSDKGSIQLLWKGEPDKIIIDNPSSNFYKTITNFEKGSALVELPIGYYSATMFGPKGQSRIKTIEVWKAPTIQLLEPQPRNRIKLGKQKYTWSAHKDVNEYKLSLTNSLEQVILPLTKNNSILYEHTKEGDFTWKVIGVDKEGFEIPPKYSFPIFIRKNPFAPPKLNKPKLLKKKNKTSFFWNFIFSKAYAAELKRTLFSWQPLEGATTYTLEISESKDFRKPLVSIQLKKTAYIWNGLNQEKTYYWRVAAGDDSGRMGVFTESTLVELVVPKEDKPKKKNVVQSKAKDLKILRFAQKDKQEVQNDKKKVIRETPVKKPIVQKEVKEPQILRSSQKDKQEVQNDKLPLIKDWAIYYQLGYSFAKFEESGSTKANLSGLSLFSGALNLNFNWSENWTINSFTQFNTNTFKPEPENQFPFQTELKTRNVNLFLAAQSQKTKLGYGLYLGDHSNVVRKDFQEVKIKQAFAMGALLQYQSEFNENWKFIERLALISQDSQWGGIGHIRIERKIFFPQLILGFQCELTYLTGSNESTFKGDTYLIIGLSF